MEKTQARLEILKLCHSNHLVVEEVVGRAKKLEAYVFEEANEAAEKILAPSKEAKANKGARGKDADKPDPLS